VVVGVYLTFAQEVAVLVVYMTVAVQEVGVVEEEEL